MVGHFDDSDVVVDFLSRAEMPRLAALGTSCPDHFLRTKVAPLVLDLPPSIDQEALEERLRNIHAQYRESYAAYYQRHAEQRLTTDAWCRPGDHPRAGRRNVLVRQGRADRASCG